jgi:DNA-directed RNA polymerase specialized sigma24 family protein
MARFSKAEFSELTTGDLASLTPGQLAVITAIADGDGYETIATNLRISIGTVKSRANRARWNITRSRFAAAQSQHVDAKAALENGDSR